MFGFLEEMATVNQITVNIVNIQQAKIDAVKFDSTNKFRKGKGDIGKTGNRQLGKNSVHSAKRKNSEKLIVQSSRRRKTQNMMQCHNEG